MGFRAVRSWSLSCLIVAFIELSIAFTLLCGSAFAFIPSKILSFFGVYFPCPCSGFFGYQNNDFCFHKLLIDWPIRKIITVQELAKTRFPFDLIWFDHQSCNLHVERIGIRHFTGGILEFEGDVSSTSISGPTAQSSVDKESGCDSKGKKVLNQKQKSGIRRRRRVALGYGKSSPALSSSSTSSHLVGTGIQHHVHDCGAMRSEFSDSLDLGSGTEDGFLDQLVTGPGDRNAPSSTDFSESIRHNFEFDGSYGKAEGINKDLVTVGNYANVIRALEQALEEEKAARIALYYELEKERAASATAADEAMAMILRLQEDKASIEMEARQYHRVIEEKFVYDEEEMKILKEILVRREKEIHFLEKEVEAYEKMNSGGNEEFEGDSSYQMNEEQRSFLSVEANLNPAPFALQVAKRWSISNEDSGTTVKEPLNYEHSQAFGKEIMSEDFASELPTSQKSVLKTISTTGREEAEKDICVISPEKKGPQSHGDCEDYPAKNEEYQNQASSNAHGSTLDTESTVYDVHVVHDTASAQNFKLLSGCPTLSMTETEPTVDGKSFDMHTKSPELGSSQFKTFNIDPLRRSPSPVIGERLKIDNEVEWLRERLRIVQVEKEKLTLSAEHRERVNAQLKLVEDAVNKLREIQQPSEPTRHASLPPLSSKAIMKKRHHRSASYDNFDSD